MDKANQSFRINSIDFMRGLVIVIMAIDHIRDLLHTTSLTQNPLDLNTTSPALFMTRWITHLCAPVFVFLAGASVYLSVKSQNDLTRSISFLRGRGVFLMVLELTVIGFGIWADIYFRTFLLQVIFAIGAGFFILSFLLKLPSRTLGIAGLAIVVLHNLTPLVHVQKEGVLGFIWTLLFDRNFFKWSEMRGLMIAYPVVPWLGIMLTGYGFGEVFRMEQKARAAILLKAGIISMLAFLLLRFFNVYGDRSSWAVHTSALKTFFSFIDVTKYPPSLLYVCVTLSIMFFILYTAEGRSNFFIRFFVVYGRVPLFFYILHWYVIHLSMFVMVRMQGVEWQDMPLGLMQFGRPETGVGLSLPFIYLYWGCLIACMYPLCAWFSRYKAENRHKRWLKYI